MAVVVQQTIPFPKQSLDLGTEQTSAWTDLLPLIRPSFEHRKLPSGRKILVDTAQLEPNTIRVVALVPPSSLPSVLLDERSVSAIACVDNLESGSEEEVSSVVENDTGTIIAKSGQQSGSRKIASNVHLVEIDSDFQFNHLVHVLNAHIVATSPNLEKAVDFVECIVTKSIAVHETFHDKTVDGKPATHTVDHPEAYEKAANAVEKTLLRTLPQDRSTDGSVTYSVHYADVNGLSRLESYIIAQEIARVMEARSLPFVLSASTVTDHNNLARGYIISTCPVPSSFLKPQPSPSAPPNEEATSSTTSHSTISNTGTLTFNPSTIRTRLTAGCSALITAEPTITHYDEIVGDGDCGLTLRDGALKTQSFMNDNADQLSSLPTFLSNLVTHLETTMGGTSGALYCIFLTALSGSLAVEEENFGNALAVALAQLLRYTRARLGDRTLLDALMPFVETLVQGGDTKSALQKAEEGVERTKELEAKLGRSTYLDDSATRGVPDPGAYGLLVLLRGLCEG